MNEISQVKLDSALRECDAHTSKLERGHGLLREFFPLTAEAFTALDESRMEHIDQFIYRFSKLQDAMGTRLFPVLYSILEDDDSPRAYIDILMRLEKLGIIEDAKEWQVLRNIRNKIAHEYPDRIDQTADALNIMYEMWPAMRRMYGRVRSCAKERIY